MQKLIAIVGPTGSGKSRLALKLAKIFRGEIVGADSRQVYRYMDTGTAKPTAEELVSIPHHLIDIINPDDEFSLAQFKDLASKAIFAIQNRQNIPILVGGTGQYVWAVLEGWEIPHVPPNLDYRQSLEKKATGEGIDGLYKLLLDSDPVAAQKIDKRNVRRVIRALEVVHQTKFPFSLLQNKRNLPYEVLILGLTAERSKLYGRVDARVDEMIRQKLVAEVEKLMGLGYCPDLPSMSGIGYRQINRYLKGEISIEEAVRQIKMETHRFIRHQYAWFRLKDTRIHWFDILSKPEAEIETLIAGYLEQD
jgi:tRNA dimethylallyltransferase